jgi:MFS superfamily sulfate permease-like transporter
VRCPWAGCAVSYRVRRLLATAGAVARGGKGGGHVIDPSQELLALGLINVFGSTLHCFPVTGTAPLLP